MAMEGGAIRRKTALPPAASGMRSKNSSITASYSLSYSSSEAFWVALARRRMRCGLRGLLETSDHMPSWETRTRRCVCR